MIKTLSRGIFGSANDRLVKKLSKRINKINALEPEMQALSDDQLKAKTQEFRQRLETGEDLDNMVSEVFATVREASQRCMGMRHFDVQLVGGLVLHNGMITEMRTGEGKTLVATLAAYLNALSGKGVHVVTVNDYLAKRDAQWMSKLYEFLGLSCAYIINGLDDRERKAAYQCDITYATNNELGFDYLRDNMKFRVEEMVQRPLNYAVIDEVDSILIDEARTPLIISGPAESSSELYIKVNALIGRLDDSAVSIDEKHRNLSLTEHGQQQLEELLKETGLIQHGGLYDIHNVNLLHHAQQAIKAWRLYTKDKDYVVHQGKVMIVDEFTGRMMDGRRFSEGLHQALEAKEGVEIQQENQTLASITFQNYFRNYQKLSGMTGTAMTEAAEFEEIYGLSVVSIPTNVPVQRQDEQDKIYRTEAEKNMAIVEDVLERSKSGQPVLLGTTTIAKSEQLSQLFKTHKINHSVLNARFHEQEAEIVANAGAPGAITIATNMAGRGTDIQLGGNLEMRLHNADEPDAVKQQHAKDKAKVLESGGLYVLGSERHESRRIDNQLRGRAGRQGDPGLSLFYISMEDDLMRIFGSERIDPLLKKLGLKDGEAITHPWLSKSMERAQKRVENRNFEIRKNLLKYDNVMNDQRTVIYEQRREIMEAEDVRDIIKEFRDDVVCDIVILAVPPKSYPDDWDIDGLDNATKRILNLDLPIQQWAKEDGVSEEELIERIRGASDQHFAHKRQQYGDDLLKEMEKSIMLQMLDQVWKEHLLALDHLRQGINLRAYAQKDPLNEYKREAFEYFSAMLERLKENVVTVLSSMEIEAVPSEPLDLFGAEEQQMQASHPSVAPEPAEQPNGTPAHTRNLSATGIDTNNPETWGRVARNAPCPCGSGKKFKHCHGAL